MEPYDARGIIIVLGRKRGVCVGGTIARVTEKMLGDASSSWSYGERAIYRTRGAFDDNNREFVVPTREKSVSTKTAAINTGHAIGEEFRVQRTKVVVVVVLVAGPRRIKTRTTKKKPRERLLTTTTTPPVLIRRPLVVDTT